MTHANPPMHFQTLNEWLGWLEHCHPREIDLGLERIREVALRLQLLRPSGRVVTVAGTNGKGSCVTAVAALLQSTGLRVGVYTSPHLLHYCERICVDGIPVSEEETCAAFEAVYAACGSTTLTYFEFGTLAALEIFSRREVDFLVLEVGLGGRLDAVNIIDPDIAVITSIDLDHQDWLGDDRETIAYEKAGIIRSGRPLICSDANPPQRLIDEAKNQQALTYWINENFGFVDTTDHWSWWGKSATNQKIEYPNMALPILPLPSLAAALQVIQLLNIELSFQTAANTLANLQLRGRFQQVTFQHRAFILDVAHNPAATEYLAKRLHNHKKAGKTLAVVAMMSDKDRYSSLRNLVPMIDSWYLADLSHLPRAATPDQMEETLAQLDVTAAGRGAVDACIQQALALAQPEDQILIFGSFFTVAAALLVMQP